MQADKEPGPSFLSSQARGPKSRESQCKTRGNTYDAGEGQHREAAVLELGELEARAVLALAEAKGVKAKVAGLAAGALSKDDEPRWSEDSTQHTFN